MNKGYPAEEYYGKPADYKKEVDSTSTQFSAHAEKRDSLRELFERKIDFVTNLWKTIESPEIANLPLDKFKSHILKASIDLERIVSNSHNLRGECESIMRDIGQVSTAFEEETIKRNSNGDSTLQTDMMIKALNLDFLNLRNRLIEKMDDPDFEFVYNVTTFLTGIVLKKTKIEPLRSLPDEDDKQKAGFDFCNYLESFNFESKYGYDSQYSITVNSNLKRLVDFLKSKVVAGDNIFDFIEINSYDISLTLNREDFDNVYIGDKSGQEDESKKITTYGVHFGKTPIILLARGDKDRTEKDLERTKIHERGHNLVDIVGDPESLDVHNTIYEKKFINGLRKTAQTFAEFFEKGNEDEAKSVAVKYMQTAIHKLNGEISADAKNIVRGYPKVFIDYIVGLVDSLSQYVLENRAKKEQTDSLERMKNIFLQIVEEELNKIKIKTVDLVIRMITYAYVARENGLEDEFCSALVLMPDSEKYLKRLLRIKLGEDFDFEKANKEINPDEIFADAPNWMRIDSHKYFGPNSVAKV